MKRMVFLLMVTLCLSVGHSHCEYFEDEAKLLQTLQQNYSVDHRPEKTTQIISSLSLFTLNRLDIGTELMSVTAVLVAYQDTYRILTGNLSLMSNTNWILSGDLPMGKFPDLFRQVSEYRNPVFTFVIQTNQRYFYPHNQQWYDSRLRWDPVNHNDIQQIVIPTKYVWTPPLVIENEVNKVGVLGSDGSPLRVLPMGIVLWTPPISTTTSCSVDITYYPYDKQTCELILTGWSYTVDEVTLTADTEAPVMIDFFDGNGEWELLNTSYHLVNLTKDAATYRKVHFQTTFRRKWQFYGQNIIIPLVLNSLLMAMVFVVPVESGEKMGYCLTVLLSYIVLLTMVSDNLPSISSQTSVIRKCMIITNNTGHFPTPTEYIEELEEIYLTVVMCIGTVGTVCTVGVLRLYNKDDRKPVPGWLHSFTRYILAPLTCQSCKENRVTSLDVKGASGQFGGNGSSFTNKEIARMVDTVFFRLFSLLMLLMTFSFLYSLNTNY